MKGNIKDKGTIKVGTFFSGIGAPEKALNKLKQNGIIKDYKVMFFSEIDKHAIKSYCAIHNIDESSNLGSILDINGNELPYCDLWLGGFPCQDISLAGKMKGFNLEDSTRSSLGWEMIRLLKEVRCKPKYVIFENVTMITSNKFVNTLNLFKKDLIDLGYSLYDDILCASDYGIPQKRRRYFLVAILDKNKKYEFPNPKKNSLVLKDFLEDKVAAKYYLTSTDYALGSKSGELVFTGVEDVRKRYTVNLEKYFKGGMCGKDENCKFEQSSRLYSDLGYAPTIPATNTSDNCKIVVGGEF